MHGNGVLLPPMGCKWSPVAGLSDACLESSQSQVGTRPWEVLKNRLLCTLATRLSKNNTLKANHGVLPCEMSQKASPERELSIACFGSLRRWAFLEIEIKILIISEISRSHRKPRPGMSTVDFWHHFNVMMDSLGENILNGHIQVQWDQESRERAWFDILRRAKISLWCKMGFSVRRQLAQSERASKRVTTY